MLFHIDRPSPSDRLPFVHIHGWCCDHEAMLPVADAFPDRGHLLVDLNGHGQSPAGPLSIESQAAAVARVAPETPFIAIGHSMGGLVALQLAVDAPERVAGVVLLDPAHIVPTPRALETGIAMQENLRRFSPSDIVSTFARQQLRGPVDEAAFDRLLSTMAATPADVARGAWDAIIAFQKHGGAVLAALQRPGLAVVIDKPVNRPGDLARCNPRITTGQVAASGHMVQLEAMDQVTAMIRRWMCVERLETPAGAV